MGLSARLAAVGRAVSGEPGVLRLASIVLIATAVVVGITTEAAMERFNAVVRTIASDSAPSVLLAGGIRESLAAMDAHAVNGFLPGAPKESFAEFGDQKEQVVKLLVDAGGNVTYGESERVPIRALVAGLADYTGYARAANMMGYPLGVPAQLKASQLMHQQILPAGEELDRANYNPLLESARYLDEHDFLIGIKITDVLLMVLLAVAQVVIAVRFRRIFNPALVLAFVLTGVCGWLVDRDLGRTRALMESAVGDAFASVHAMSKAKALAFDANGDESLYLLDSSKAAQTYFDDSFKQKVMHLFSAPVTARVRDQFSSGMERREKVPYDGYLADALNNVTFAGEDKLALDALDALKRYLEVDERIRDLERGGQHAKAIELALGDNPGESNYAFNELDRALTALSKLNEVEFEQRMTMAQALLRRTRIVAPTVIGLVALLAFIGMKFRIDEFA